ncbi:DUF418 domain-containing protein [Anaerobacillus alkalilacustris]|uniref:DUF418 domain-containing protein n=1 Tax=Anaerobacillus alkalilacustris TaxID=393763 RepID=UPI000B1139DC|nr:DUF418 domain-containing protein [Anaerobacillus alkalilacustris]
MSDLIKPTEQNERIVPLDIIRGFALLGILVVNMQFFNTPKLFVAGTEISLFNGIASQIAHYFILIFATGKFFTIFSFLFGLGFFIFMNRVEQKGFLVAPLYRRRLFFLLVIGFIHAIIIWSGDILLPYALAGFFLLLFKDKSKEVIKKWAITLYVIVNFIIGIFAYLSTLVLAVFNNTGQFSNQHEELVERAVFVYQNGSFLEILSFRLAEEVPLILLNLLVTVPFVLSVFLFGLYVGKKGILTNITGHLLWIKKVWNRSFLYSFILTMFYLVLEFQYIIIPFYLHDAIIEVLGFAIGLIMCFFYMTSIVILCSKEKKMKILMFLAPVGQMALTNYLLQTFICLVIFIGFGLYGKVTPEIGIIIAFIVFVSQVFFSHYWLKNHKFGPMEWLWRIYTYKTYFNSSEKL